MQADARLTALAAQRGPAAIAAALWISLTPGHRREQDRIRRFSADQRVSSVLHQRIDIALDPFPYGGGTTTCDALWMGVPVVSLVGELAVGRAGLSILSNVGLPELAAKNVEAYIETSVALAGDPRRLIPRHPSRAHEEVAFDGLRAIHAKRGSLLSPYVAGVVQPVTGRVHGSGFGVQGLGFGV